MGMSILTAIKIKNSKVKVLVVGPSPEGKFSGLISLVSNCSPLISSNACFGSKEEAEQAMNDIIYSIMENKDIPGDKK